MYAVAPFAEPRPGEARRDAGRRPCPATRPACWPATRRCAAALSRAGRAADRRRAAGDRARWAVGRRRAGRAYRRQAGLGAAARGRPRRGRRRLPAQPAARRPPGHRRRPPAPSSATAWGLATGAISGAAGRDTDAILAAAAAGAARRAGRRPASTRPTWPTRRWPRRRWTRCRSWSAWSCGTSAVARRADVVFPVAPVAEKAGTFLDWEGRLRTFDDRAGHHRDDRRPGAGRARRASWTSTLGYRRRRRDPPRAGRAAGDRGRPAGRADASPPARAGHARRAGEAVLATWHQLIDLGSLLDGDEVLAGTARPPVVRLGKATADALGVADGDAGHGRHRPGRDHPAGRDHRHAATAWSGCRPTRPGSTVRRTPRRRPPARSSGSRRRARSDPAGAGSRAVNTLDPAGAGPDAGRLRQRRLVDRPHQARRSSSSSCVLHDAASTIWSSGEVVARMAVRPGPNQVGPVRPAADPRRRPEAGVQGRHHAEDRRQGGLLLRPGDLGDRARSPRSSVIPFGPMVSHLRAPDRRCSSPTCRWRCWCVLACSSMGVYGIVLGGWASGSTYPLLGGLRSSAQMISYEVAMGLSIVAVFMTAGTMSTSRDRGRRRPATAVELSIFGWHLDRAGLVRDPAAAQLRHLLHLRGRRDQPGPVRPARGRVRAGRRLPHRVLVAQVRAVLPGRVHQHGHRLGARAPRCSWAAGGHRGRSPLLGGRQLRLVAAALVRSARSCCCSSSSSGCGARCPGCATTSSCGSAGRSCSRSTWSGSCSWPASGCASNEQSTAAPAGWSSRGIVVVVLLVALLWPAKPEADAVPTHRASSSRARPPGSFPLPPIDLQVPPSPRATPRGRRAAAGHRRRRADASDERRCDVGTITGSVKGFGVTFAHMFRKVVTTEYPFEAADAGAALPRPAHPQPAPGRAGEVHRLRAVRLGLPGRRDLRRGRRQHRRAALLAG